MILDDLLFDIYPIKYRLILIPVLLFLLHLLLVFFILYKLSNYEQTSILWGKHIMILSAFIILSASMILAFILHNWHFIRNDEPIIIADYEKIIIHTQFFCLFRYATIYWDEIKSIEIREQPLYKLIIIKLWHPREFFKRSHFFDVLNMLGITISYGSPCVLSTLFLDINADDLYDLLNKQWENYANNHSK